MGNMNGVEPKRNVLYTRRSLYPLGQDISTCPASHLSRSNLNEVAKLALKLAIALLGK
jgi:hypothetical protein